MPFREHLNFQRKRNINGKLDVSTVDGNVLCRGCPDPSTGCGGGGVGRSEHALRKRRELQNPG